MTVDELTRLLNDTYGISKWWPKTFEVDHQTYANVCQRVFEVYSSSVYTFPDTVSVLIGPNKSVMFKGVELILKKE